ncbi:uncharacterized protein LOC109601597 [Aethina tumida]|uniref:uncharacterized protein LOC109601597 n=1 Tax=Aethina tumida TaxID=116153 RepID=UPI002147BEDD|nr:uncharacterized protein LOC109601597 [Aethina tumida]
MVFCCQAMKGEIINCSTHKDIYFLETNTKNETADFANLFASPAGREMFKYKPRPKHKQKLNPALDFLIQNQGSGGNTSDKRQKPSCQSDEKCIATSSSSSTTPSTVEEGVGSRSRRNSIDLYEEAASILGLTCQQTDDCKCLECQCHYFDFEEDIDFPTGGDYVMDHSSSCCIQ